MKKLYLKFIGFSQENTLFMMILMIVLITFELVYLKNNLKIDTDLKALFKGHNPTVLELQDMEERVGTYSTVLVV
ncbi:MAG TPA: hypothetical protein PK102_12870, partial [bacterium]|nr:hypothetical protein [bacterium]